MADDERIDAVLNDLTRTNSNIQRVAGTASAMPPFNATEGTGMGFGSVLRSKYKAPPKFQADTRELDSFLYEFALTEPHLQGILGQVIAMIRNRGFTLAGGRNQVLRVSSILQNANRREGARFGDGWRNYIGLMAKAFYVSCFGAISEVGRTAPFDIVHDEVTAPPLAALWSGDPTKFKMRRYGSRDYPLRYYPISYHPNNSRVNYWSHADFFRIVANPDGREEFGGVGYSNVAICRELAEIMIAVYQYDKEQLGARAPTGLLLLKNIDQAMWDSAMKSRNEQLSDKEREYYGGVAVLAQMGVDDVDAKLLALSQLPAGFDKAQVIDLLVYLYSMVFKFPPDEFWPVRTGSFQRTAGEVSIGYERATSKGEFEFLNEFQSQLQQELPAAVSLVFDERDNRGRQMAAEVALTWAQVVERLKGSEIITAEQAMTILAREQLVPVEWTEIVEDSQVDDLGQLRMSRLRDEARSNPRVQRAISMYSRLDPSMPIVSLHWPTNRTTTLWESAGEAARPTVFPVGEKHRAILYEGDDFTITDEDVDAAISSATDVDELFGELLVNEPLTEEEDKKLQEER